MSSPPAGIYLHWPFCERKCPYCDFYTFGREHPAHARQAAYADALIAEIRTAPERFGWSGRPQADTIYLGGGTPSLMGPEVMERIFCALDAVFTLDPAREVTLEVNPTTAEAARLEDYRTLGVNRISVGAQSFNDRILTQLGRVHDAATTRRALARMRAVGVTNLSVDLIFAAPTQTAADLDRDLDEILAFGAEHVSAYGLTIHAATPYERWQREGRLALPAEEDAAAMYERLIDRLAAGGLGHYEISNWARAGLESRHNSKYWHQCDVAGFGVSAHGVWQGTRTENPRDLDAYCDPVRRAWARPLDPPAGERSRAGEVMMLALRRIPGASWAELERWTGRDLRAFYGPELARLAADGLLTDGPGGVRLTRQGLLLADMVMTEFF